jgi:hypothetical protein
MSRELRERMVADMELAGLSKSTQAEYLRAVEAFVRQTWLSPAEAQEADLAEYLRSIVGKGVAKGTFKPARYGLQFLFQNTLGRDWALFKKNSEFPAKSDSRQP